MNKESSTMNKSTLGKINESRKKSESGNRNRGRLAKVMLRLVQYISEKEIRRISEKEIRRVIE
jgi:hypothetical protein